MSAHSHKAGQLMQEGNVPLGPPPGFPRKSKKSLGPPPGFPPGPPPHSVRHQQTRDSVEAPRSSARSSSKANVSLPEQSQASRTSTRKSGNKAKLSLTDQSQAQRSSARSGSKANVPLPEQSQGKKKNSTTSSIPEDQEKPRRSVISEVQESATDSSESSSDATSEVQSELNEETEVSVEGPQVQAELNEGTEASVERSQEPLFDEQTESEDLLLDDDVVSDAASQDLVLDDDVVSDAVSQVSQKPEDSPSDGLVHDLMMKCGNCGQLIKYPDWAVRVQCPTCNGITFLKTSSPLGTDPRSLLRLRQPDISDGIFGGLFEGLSRSWDLFWGGQAYIQDRAIPPYAGHHEMATDIVVPPLQSPGACTFVQVDGINYVTILPPNARPGDRLRVKLSRADSRFLEPVNAWSRRPQGTFSIQPAAQVRRDVVMGRQWLCRFGFKI